MSNGLCYESGRDMPPGMQVAMAKKIIEEEAKVRLEVVMELDIDCLFCKHATFDTPCIEKEELPDCEKCQCICNCRGCVDNSKYEWCGATEARRRLAETKGAK